MSVPLMLGGLIYNIKPVITSKYTYITSKDTIFQFSHLLNRLNNKYTPTKHQILSTQSYCGSDTLLLIYNKKRVIAFDTIKGSYCNFSEYPQDSEFITAFENVVVLREHQKISIYHFVDNMLVPLLKELVYYQSPVLITKPSIFIQQQNGYIYFANNREIKKIDSTTMVVQIIQQYHCPITSFALQNDIVFAGLADGSVFIRHHSYDFKLQYHAHAVVEVLPIPCSSGLPILYTSDFTQNIAQWTGQRQNYVRKIIGPLMSSVYNISYGENNLYIQLDCNKIFVYEQISAEQSFCLSSTPAGLNMLSQNKYVTPKIRNGQLFIQCIPGAIDVIQSLIGPFYTATTIFLYQAYSKSDVLQRGQTLPQIKFFEIYKDYIICILEISNQFLSESRLIISSLNGGILYSIANVIPEKCTNLIIKNKNIYICFTGGLLELELEGDQLRQLGFRYLENQIFIKHDDIIYTNIKQLWYSCDIINQQINIKSVDKSF
eukprot:EST48393.1 Hypothetical protein SS50377_11429 [Spironucleus salmonicida]